MKIVIFNINGTLYCHLLAVFTARIRGPKDSRAKQYTLQAHYYARGPMGYGMGKLEIIEFDGHGKAQFQERPYLVMDDHAYADLGTIRIGGARK